MKAQSTPATATPTAVAQRRAKAQAQAVAAAPVQVEQADESDLPAIYRLLMDNGLPTEGLSGHLGTILVARDGARDGTGPASVVGSTALELYGQYALLRSVAVEKALRGLGIGVNLTKAALDLARARYVKSIYMLTETAADFFPRFGFRVVSRDTVPDEVLQSVEFSTLCPQSATVMRLDLDQGEQLEQWEQERRSETRSVRLATPGDAAAIATIYNQGIEDRVATFETRRRTDQDILGWLDGKHPVVVVEDGGGRVIAFASTSGYRPRECYAGVAEFSVYVAREARGQGAGRAAMERLIVEAERGGFWKLLSRIFPENTASRALVRSLGFREVGMYEKHARLDGVWRDVVIVEKVIPANLL